MAVIIDMPKLSDTMTVGRLIKWLKNEGDSVEPGDSLAEVETDKATMEVENFDEGVLLKQFVKEDEEVPIGAPIAAIGQSGEAIPEIKAQAPSSPAQKPSPPLEDHPEEKPLAQSPLPSTASIETPLPTAPGNRVKASPLARKMASDQGISLESLTGSGPGGRIVKVDILAAIEKGPATATAPAAGTVTLEDKLIPVTNMRATIARRLVESKTQIPHFYLDIEVNATPLLELRTSLNKNLAELPPEQGGIKFTVNDFILKASAEALRRVPAVNVSWQESNIHQFANVNLAFGVAVDEGLLTPVIRNAQAKSLRQVSLEAKDLIGKARNKKLNSDAMSGSTFTVTNLGMFGISNFHGIINPPNAAILSVGTALKKPVVDAQGNLTVGHRMNIGFSGDHRVIDGTTGAQFLAALKSILETPSLMLV